MKPSMHDGTDSDERATERGRIVLVDGLLALAMAVVTVAPFLFYENFGLVIVDGEASEFSEVGVPAGSSHWWILAVAAAIVAPITVRRLWPRTSFTAVLLLTVAAMLPAVVELTGGASTFLLGMNLPLLVSAFTFANLVDRRSAVATAFVAAAAVIAGAFAPFAFEDGAIPVFWADVVNTFVYAVTPVALVVVVAQVLRDQRIRADAAQRETAMAMVSAELRAAAAASAERRRLAAELHDIVAHHVNLMVVQAEKGPFVRDADGSARTYATIAETGRAALGELDRLLGVLRTDGTGSVGAPTTAPLPTIDQVPSLVDAANRAGVAVVLQAFDPPAVVDAAISATVHRIVQECITNIVKHADRSEPASVSVTGDGAAIVVRATNRVSGERAGGRRRGHGLDSMRSRLEVFAGTLDVDDRDGWFRVEAVVPLAATGATPMRTAVTA